MITTITLIISVVSILFSITTLVIVSQKRDLTEIGATKIKIEKDTPYIFFMDGITDEEFRQVTNHFRDFFGSDYKVMFTNSKEPKVIEFTDTK